LMQNTWGDAIVAVMDEALPLVEYAATLQRVMKSAPAMGLPEKMNIRIGLHAGPAYDQMDPITGRRNFFGSHVNRAARIEPVTLPGRIYASQQFMGLLTAELRHRGVDPWPFICEWLGTLELAKGFGKLPIYHIRERRTGEEVVSVSRYDGSA
jgi:class 3 adenylate cyclase